MYPKCYHKYQISVYQVRNNANFLKKIKYFSEIFYFYRIKYTVEMKCIIHIILVGILIVGSVRLLLLKDQGAYTESVSISPDFTDLLHNFTQQPNPCLLRWWM